MEDEWLETRVEGIAASSRNAIVGGPFGSDLVSRDYTPTGVPIIRGQNMGSRWVSGDFAFVSEAKARSLEANLARPDDIIFTQRGTLGQVSIVPAGAFDRYLISQSQMKLTLDGEIADPMFFYYVFLTAEQQNYIRQNAIQTGVPHTNLGILRRTPLPLPPLCEQRAIAHILGTLDDKVELNRQMNETLEAMARALFKSWFVDFDPVRAKAEGRDAFYAPELWSLFPDALDADDKPLGWPLGTLIDLCELKRGYDLPTAQRSPGSYPIVSSSGISGSHSAPMAQGPGVVTGRYGTIGEVYFISEPYWPLNTALYVRDFKGNSPRFVYYELLHVDFLQYSDKAAVPGINRNHLHQAPVVLPSRAVQQAFATLLAPVWARQESNKAEIATLAALRDMLLPKLISGELRVKAAEKLVEAVA
jgi:type I restriction enzyme S subunit